MSDILTKEKAVDMLDCLIKTYDRFLKEVDHRPISDDWDHIQYNTFQQFVNTIHDIKFDIEKFKERFKNQ